MTAPPDRVRGRLATGVAVTALGLDGLLLVGAGGWGGSPGLLIGGIVCLFLAALVLLAWRRHLRVSAELAQARRELLEEVESLRRLIRK